MSDPDRLDQAQWFQPFGTCAHPGCSKPATGTVMGTRNQNLGKYCEPHGSRRVIAARHERAKREHQ